MEQAVSQETINACVRAAHGNLTKLRDLAEKYPSALHARASWNETALEAANHTASKEIVEFLVASGVEQDIFSAIILERIDDVAEFLERHPELAKAQGAHGIPILFYAAAVGNTRIGEMLIACGADVNAGAGGNTALHGAAWFGRLDFARWLLRQGADVQAKDYGGKTPLAVAEERGQAELAELLRRHDPRA
jgi:ankyrin repeat protein